MKRPGVPGGLPRLRRRPHRGVRRRRRGAADGQRGHRPQPDEGAGRRHQREGHGDPAPSATAGWWHWSSSIAPSRGHPADTDDLVPSTPESLALSKSLKKAGFAFVGPTTMHALMEAIGLVDDHLVGCHAAAPDSSVYQGDGPLLFHKGVSRVDGARHIPVERVRAHHSTAAGPHRRPSLYVSDAGATRRVSLPPCPFARGPARPTPGRRWRRDDVRRLRMAILVGSRRRLRCPCDRRSGSRKPVLRARVRPDRAGRARRSPDASRSGRTGPGCGMTANEVVDRRGKTEVRVPLAEIRAVVVGGTYRKGWATWLVLDGGGWCAWARRGSSSTTG